MRSAKPANRSVADTITYYDYEFHFTSGELLCVTVQEGRDSCNPCANGTGLFVVINEPNRRQQLTIDATKLNAWQFTQRIEKIGASIGEQIEVASEFMRCLGDY